MVEVAKRGSVQEIEAIPPDIRKLFVTTFDIPPEQHLRIQAAFQKFTDNSVSKTINLPFSATIEDVKTIYLTAYRMGCKGITVYRYGCKRDQTLSLEDDIPLEFQDAGPIWADTKACSSSICLF